MLGMAIAIFATLIHPDVKNYTWIIVGIFIGGGIGTFMALRVQMTSMPELVAILHSFVGLAAVAVAYGTLLAHPQHTTLSMIEISIGSVIGAITFTGSVIAFGKLKGSFGSKPLLFSGQHYLNLFLV